MKTSGSSRRELEIVSSIAEALNSAPSVQEARDHAIAGRDTIEKAYAVALEHEYLWHEFGDLHLIV